MAHLKIENLTKNLFPYSEENILLLRHLNLETEIGKTTALLQLSGSSASVLFRILSGQLFPDCGKISLDGTDITPVLPLRPKPGISYILPSVSPGNESKDLTVAEYFEKRKSNVRLPFLSKKSDLDYRSLLPRSFYGENTHTPKLLKELCPGQRLLLSLLLPLSENPALLLIDLLPCLLPEEAAGQALQALSAVTDKNNTALLFTTFSPLSAFRLAERIWVFREEYLLHTFDNTAKKPALLEKLLHMQREASAYLPAHSSLVRSLTEQQYI